MHEITIWDDICGSAYFELVDYLLKQSTSILFHLPNMGKTLVNERNAALMAESIHHYEIGYSEEINQECHIEYVAKY